MSLNAKQMERIRKFANELYSDSEKNELMEKSERVLNEAEELLNSHAQSERFMVVILRLLMMKVTMMIRVKFLVHSTNRLCD